LIFSELIAPTDNTKFSRLRPAQEHALQAYARDAHAASDIAIELPTGAGKTLIALLILEYWRKQGRTVAILTGNKTLARQLVGEAEGLGAPAVRFEGRGDLFPPKDLRAYRRAEAIGVMNYWVYINQNPSVEPADYLVLDDAQLAEGALVSLYTVRVGRYEHRELFEEMLTLISQYSDTPVADDHVKGIEQGPWGPTDLIPFPVHFEMWEELEALVEQALSSAGASGTDWTGLRFSWGRLRSNGLRALLLISADEVVLRPYVFPTQDYKPLSVPAQRIFMSATLHDPDDLRRRLGTGAIHKLDIPPMLSREEDGRRLFIFNQTASPATRGTPTEEALVPLRELLRAQKKSVWLCSARNEVATWREWVKTELGPTAQTFELSATGDELEDFCNRPAGHLFIAGRFEGMDFPDDTCRLAVFPSLPIATGALERFTTEQLKDALFQRTRMLERIKQGIGRCTRGRDDYAVYYFMDTRFTSEMEGRTFATLLSERTRKQVEVGLELTQDGMGTVVPFATKFLEGDFTEFDLREGRARPQALSTLAPSRPNASVAFEVAGWRALFEARNLSKAAGQFEQAFASLTDAEREHRAFWAYMQSFAEFLRFKMDEEAAALPRCINFLGRAVEEGGSTSWFNRLRRAMNKLAGEATPSLPEHDALFDRWDELVERFPYRKARFLKWQARLKEYLDGTHEQVCEALETLGGVLDFRASRPRGSGMPDGLWLATDHAVTLEAKIDLDRDFISLGDVNQADGHRRSAQMAHALDEEHVAAVIVTSVTSLDPAAERAMGAIRVLHIDQVSELQSRLEAVMRDYWKGWTRGEAQRRRVVRAAAAISLPPSGWLLRTIRDARGHFISSPELLKEWP
jgi:hypothetical protein